MLQQLIEPVSLETFWSEYWEKRPLYVARPMPDWCRDMPTFDDLDAILDHTTAQESGSKDYMVRSDAYGVESYSVERGPDGLPDMSAIYRAYAKGWSIGVHKLHRRSTPVARLASGVALDIGHKVTVNLYCTPSEAKGFSAHADSHDVIILQLEGRKSWRVYAPQYLLPLEPQETVVKRGEHELGAPVLEVTTSPGQIVYLPRGFIHEAVRTEVPSMHLTIGIFPLRWLDLLEAGLRVVAERNELFRHAVPSFTPGDESRADEIGREFASLLKAVQGREVAMEAMARCAGARSREFRTSPEPHFNAIERARSIAAHTEVVRRLGWSIRVTRTNSNASIEFGTRVVSGPPSIAEALEFVAKHERFRVDDLPDTLTEQSKVVLVRRLIQEGLLKIAT